jgi:hypothetical protein
MAPLTAGIPDAEAPRLEAPYGSWADDGHLLLLGLRQQRPSFVFWHALSDDRDGAQAGVRERVFDGRIDGAVGGEVDEGINLGVGGDGGGGVLIHGQKDLGGAPVELLEGVPTERVDGT